MSNYIKKHRENNNQLNKINLFQINKEYNKINKRNN